MRALAAILAAILLAAPLAASTFFEVEKTCPVGGEKFKYMEMGSSSSWGALPDGMPIGSGPFPYPPPQCPGNGLVMYEEFDAAQVAKLAPLVAGETYRRMRSSETVYYLAYWLANALGDRSEATDLLLAATWEAKNKDPQGALARRYNAEYVARIRSQPADAKSLLSIARRARAVNALRELGRFEEAEALRAGILIAPDASGTGADDADNRKGWRAYLDALAAPIARRDPARAPIDLASERDAAFRCLSAEFHRKRGGTKPAPLSAFEQQYCARPELANELADMRETLRY